jgi:hypothetical protein
MILLMGVGLVFFLRAAGKDRTETRVYLSSLALEQLGQRLGLYFKQRSYQLKQMDATGLATFVGQAQPSLFLQIFLSGLAAMGLACLAVVIGVLQPQWQPIAWGLLLLAPLAGGYYRQRNQGQEQVQARVRTLSTAEGMDRVQLQISAHRDELNRLEATLGSVLQEA